MTTQLTNMVADVVLWDGIEDRAATMVKRHYSDYRARTYWDRVQRRSRAAAIKASRDLAAERFRLATTYSLVTLGHDRVRADFAEDRHVRIERYRGRYDVRVSGTEHGGWSTTSVDQVHLASVLAQVFEAFSLVDGPESRRLGARLASEVVAALAVDTVVREAAYVTHEPAILALVDLIENDPDDMAWGDVGYSIYVTKVAAAHGLAAEALDNVARLWHGIAGLSFPWSYCQGYEGCD